MLSVLVGGLSINVPVCFDRAGLSTFSRPREGTSGAVSLAPACCKNLFLASLTEPAGGKMSGSWSRSICTVEAIVLDADLETASPAARRLGGEAIEFRPLSFFTGVAAPFTCATALDSSGCNPTLLPSSLLVFARDTELVDDVRLTLSCAALRDPAWTGVGASTSELEFLERCLEPPPPARSGEFSLVGLGEPVPIARAAIKAVPFVFDGETDRSSEACLLNGGEKLSVAALSAASALSAEVVELAADRLCGVTGSRAPAAAAWDVLVIRRRTSWLLAGCS
ncbi:hypothetical protein ABW21_db0201541 [Orbilia brochopaga]|nr:hypothetical protein ABW21_db0201541 [Drechslerella brochopaga]